MSSVHDSIISDGPKPNSSEKVDEEQTFPDVKIVAAIEKKPTATSNKDKIQSTIHDSVSNTSLSQEEILALKRKKHNWGSKTAPKIV